MYQKHFEMIVEDSKKLSESGSGLPLY